MQIRPRPLVQIGRRVVGIDQRRGRLFIRIGKFFGRIGDELDDGHLFQPADLIVLGKLRQRERQPIVGPRIVAQHAFVPAGIMPGLDALSAGRLRIADRQHAILARGFDERGVGLLVVPAVSVSMPLAAVEVQKLRLEPLARRRIAAFHFHRKCFHQQPILGKHELPFEHRARHVDRLAMHVDARQSRQRDEALRRRMIGPLRGDDRKRHDARRGPIVWHRCEQTGVAEFGRKLGVRAAIGIGLNFVDRAKIVVEDVQLAVVRFAKGDESRAAADQFAMRDRLVAVESRTPHAASLPIAANVTAGQLLEPLAAIHVAADDRASVGVRVGKVGRNDRRRAALGVGINRLRALHDAPAIVAPFLDSVDALPQFPTDIADPQIARLPVEAHPPRISQAVGPHFAARAGVFTNGLSAGIVYGRSPDG